MVIWFLKGMNSYFLSKLILMKLPSLCLTEEKIMMNKTHVLRIRLQKYKRNVLIRKHIHMLLLYSFFLCDYIHQAVIQFITQGEIMTVPSLACCVWVSNDYQFVSLWGIPLMAKLEVTSSVAREESQNIRFCMVPQHTSCPSPTISPLEQFWTARAKQRRCLHFSLAVWNSSKWKRRDRFMVHWGVMQNLMVWPPLATLLEVAWEICERISYKMSNSSMFMGE